MKFKFYGRAFVDSASYYDVKAVEVAKSIDSYEFLHRTPLPPHIEGLIDFPGHEFRGNCDCPVCTNRILRKTLKPNKKCAKYDSIDTMAIKCLSKVDVEQPLDYPYMLCSRNVKGFLFKSRTWGTHLRY